VSVAIVCSPKHEARNRTPNPHPKAEPQPQVRAAVEQGASAAWMMAASRQAETVTAAAAAAAAPSLPPPTPPPAGGLDGAALRHALSSLREVGGEWRRSFSPAPKTPAQS
jgi:hypothetical protein